ncbi:MAG TPA: noncanonical pyrimidine nucleotidase, YjjG family, partial [Flavobacterium sp.]
MKHITDVFFDLDHTLWDFEKNSALAFENILNKYDINVDHSAFLSFYVPLNFQYWVKYRNEEISQQELRYRRLKDTFDLLEY